MTEFIIVGRGLAASVLAHTLHDKKITFKIIGKSQLSNCSRVAAGIWNPVVFKRLTKSWLANELVPSLNNFYTHCEQKLNKKLITQRTLIKPFTEEQEKILWYKKAATDLNDFLDHTIYNTNAIELLNCNINNQYGRVYQSGNLDMVNFLDTTASYFESHLLDEIFDHEQLIINNDYVSYKGVSAKNIVFCEGYLVKNNPYFKWIPLKPAKGEVLTISTSELHLNNHIFNKNGFLMDVTNSNYIVGATYEWQDLSPEPTENGLSELKSKLKQLISCNYTITEHKAGIRPSSIDRRPIIGKHPKHTNLFVFNGLGTKGVMLAPYFAKKFVNFYSLNEPLPNDVNIDRFYTYYAE